MLTKMACGCAHNDTEWTKRCDTCKAADDIVSARWARDRMFPPKVVVHRINGVLQNVAYIPEVDQVSPEVMKAMIPPFDPPASIIKGDIYQAVAAKILQEGSCPEPTPQPTSGSETISQPSETTDYSALLNQL